MIKNSQQYRSTRLALASLRIRLEAIGDDATDLIAREREELTKRVAEMRSDMELYERLQVTESSLLPVESLSALPNLLIAARIARGMTQKELAEFMGLKMQQIQKYEVDRYESASLRRIAMVADALALDIFQAGELNGKRTLNHTDPSKASCFPVGEMYRRGWLGPYRGSLIDARNTAPEDLKDFFAKAWGPQANLRHRYARSANIPHEPALSAWEARVMILTDFRPPIREFLPVVADANWLRSLAGLSRERDGVRRARQHLLDAGIALVVEEALPGMHIDGAALRTCKGNYSIALTLRDPRLETFWITLMHEVAHLVLHIAPGKYDSIFDDVNAPAGSDDEDEADVFSREALIPSRAWASCKSQFTWTREAILADARHLGVGPAVVVGHIRRQAGDIQFPNRVAANADVREQLHD